MMTSLVGKVALVTGASSGIGAAIAERLVREGATVVGCARREDRLKALSEKLIGCSGKLEYVTCDVSKESELLAMFEGIKNKHGGLDICVNNAGFGRMASLLEGATQDWRDMLDVNVLALSICSRESVKLFQLKASPGHIVNIGSVAGYTCNVTSTRHWYSANKWMVRALSECLRLELREKGARTRVTLVSPGMTETEIMVKECGEEVSREHFASVESLTAEQVADSVYFCLSAAPNMQMSEVIVRPTSQNV